ncbi:Uncharacterized protein Fot_08936 [Forsythia ovata]|uniref:Uncharacterized protein n=1 Tax=Forsythia ovata TaxID=205694 RepID=A0ABD1WCK8_9LAMI
MEKIILPTRWRRSNPAGGVPRGPCEQRAGAVALYWWCLVATLDRLREQQPEAAACVWQRSHVLYHVLPSCPYIIPVHELMIGVPMAAKHLVESTTSSLTSASVGIKPNLPFLKTQIFDDEPDVSKMNSRCYAVPHYLGKFFLGLHVSVLGTSQKPTLRNRVDSPTSIA